MWLVIRIGEKINMNIETLNALILALLGSGAVGMLVSFLIQLGKLFAPKWFPDNSADNWRLGLTVGIAVIVFGAQAAGYLIGMEKIEAISTSIAALGATVMPLLVLFANWIAKSTYANLLKGVWKIGASHTKKE
jgi:hypothetical protein